MTASLLLRAPAQEDFSKIHAIFAHSVETGTASFNLAPPSLSEFTIRMERLIEQGFPFIVAIMDGETVGYAWVDWFRPRPGYRFTVEDSVYVAPTYQGQGIGKALLSRVLDEAKEKGYKQVIAVIGDTANTGSIKLHEACGFEHVGLLKRVGFKFDQWLDSVYMQKSL